MAIQDEYENNFDRYAPSIHGPVWPWPEQYYR
jgi:hypothetical protein